MPMFDARAIKTSFSRAAGNYDANAHLQRVVRQYCLHLAKPLLPKGARVLDAGCGTGALFTEAAGLGWRMVGFDLSGGMCTYAARKNHPVINADATQMPITSESIDGIISSLMLQWANDPQAVLAEMQRVLTPGGYVVLSTLAEGTLIDLKRSFAVLDNDAHVSEFEPAHRLLALAENSGLSLVSARQIAMVEHYPDTVALMQALKSIGAGNKHVNRKRGLMTSRQFARLEQEYQKYSTPQGIPATWQVLYLVLRK
jgi:malonyl-CoA O-methyltransferase